MKIQIYLENEGLGDFRGDFETLSTTRNASVVSVGSYVIFIVACDLLSFFISCVLYLPRMKHSEEICRGKSFVLLSIQDTHLNFWSGPLIFIFDETLVKPDQLGFHKMFHFIGMLIIYCWFNSCSS